MGGGGSTQGRRKPKQHGLGGVTGRATFPRVAAITHTSAADRHARARCEKESGHG